MSSKPVYCTVNPRNITFSALYIELDEKREKRVGVTELQSVFTWRYLRGLSEVKIGTLVAIMLRQLVFSSCYQ